MGKILSMLAISLIVSAANSAEWGNYEESFPAEFMGNWEESFPFHGGCVTHTPHYFYFTDQWHNRRGIIHSESLTVGRTLKKGHTAFNIPADDANFQKVFFEALDPEMRKEFQPSEEDYLPGFSLKVNCTREEFLENLNNMEKSGYKL